MDNMEIYNLGRAVPKEAQKTIQAGRLKGMTDINPMFRINKLTEIFGPCGIGWKYVITREELVPGANDEVSCFMDIDLFYKWDGQWSEAIPGTGGASYVAKERNGLYVSDECYKMALTDALSVACKALGIGADVYWAAGRTKYTGQASDQKPMEAFCEDCKKKIEPTKKKDGEIWPVEDIVGYSKRRFNAQLCPACQKKRFEAEKAANGS